MRMWAVRIATGCVALARAADACMLGASTCRAFRSAQHTAAWPMSPGVEPTSSWPCCQAACAPASRTHPSRVLPGAAHLAWAHQVAVHRLTRRYEHVQPVAEHARGLAGEYGLDVEAVDAHAESVQEDESGAERGAHWQRFEWLQGGSNVAGRIAGSGSGRRPPG